MYFLDSGININKPLKVYTLTLSSNSNSLLSSYSLRDMTQQQSLFTLPYFVQHVVLCPVRVLSLRARHCLHTPSKLVYVVSRWFAVSLTKSHIHLVNSIEVCWSFNKVLPCGLLLIMHKPTKNRTWQKNQDWRWTTPDSCIVCFVISLLELSLAITNSWHHRMFSQEMWK